MWTRVRNYLLYYSHLFYLNLPSRVQKRWGDALSGLLPGGYGQGLKLWADALAEDHDIPLLLFLRRFIKEVRPNPFGTFVWNVLRIWLIEGRRLRVRMHGKKIPYPALLQLSLTTRCNYRCKGCYAEGWTKNEELDYECIKRLLAEGKEYGCTYYTLLGGEPFIYPHILDIFYDHPDRYFQVYTNGSLITDEVARHLERAGNVQAMISLEGLQMETDWRRGEGAYRNACKAMARLRREGVPFGVGVTVTPKNIDVVCSDKFVREMIRNGVLYMWYFWFQPYGDFANVDLMLDGDQRYRLWHRINEIRQKYPVLSADMFNDYSVVGCLASSGVSLNVTPSGMVEPCAQMHFSAGNINEASLRQIVGTSSFFEGVFDFYRRGDKRCLVQDCGKELADVIVRTGARDDTGGRDLKALYHVANCREGMRLYTREEMDDFPDPFLPFKQWFFDCLKPLDRR